MAPKRKLEDAAATDDPPPSSSAIVVRAQKKKMAAEVERQHADAAAAADDERQSSSSFHRHKEDVLMLSASDQILHKNLDHYGLLRQPGNLYWSTQQGWMLIMEYLQEQPYTSSAAAYLPAEPSHGRQASFQCSSTLMSLE